MTTAHLDTFARDRLPPKKQWPELLFDLPGLQYPARLNAAAELLDRAVAEGDGQRPAIWMPVDGQPVVATYAQLQRRVNRIARVLTEDFGLKPGNRVLLRGPNNAMMAACWLAVIKAGLIAVATMPLLRAKELKQVIDKAQITHALCSQPLWQEIATCTNPNSEHFAPTLARIGYFDDGDLGSLEELLSFKRDDFTAVDTAADDVALIAFTSGTTGEPKGTVHFHRDILAMCDCFPRSCLKATRNDIFCGTPPLAFTFGLGGMLAFPMRARASTVLVEKLSPDLLLGTIDTFKATICFTAPTFYRQMAALAAQHNPQHSLKSLKKCVSAGEALPDATRQLFKQATGIEIIDGIGATEMMHIFISHTPETVRRGATGKPIPGYQARVQDEQGKPCPPNVVGRLAVKGPTGCRYLDDPRQANYVQKGWNLTGDAYMMDADGYFFYQARTDDMIISAGYNIAGPEVESCLLAHEAVAECGVIGLPDEERGQIVKAFVVLKAGYYGNQAMTKTLQDYVKKEIAPYKYPRKIEYVESLPRTETGKLQRFRLRQMASV
ncbi:MAG TPA: AMP-binding protein [Burkholderiales bacterium]|jgi:2-aminobenzoate-CoA ligase|nr:AMP-binding protein [Burkholderiales bacterium]